MRCNVINSKYVRYYRLDTETDSKGKVRTKMVYTGPLYKWDMVEAELKSLKTALTVLSLISCIFFVGSLSFYSELSRTWYIILPYAINFLLICMQWGVVWNLFFSKQPMSMEIKDKTLDREKTVSVICLIINIITLLCAVVTIIVKGHTKAGEFVFVGMVTLLVAFTLYRIKVDKCMRVAECENSLTKEWEQK